MHCKANKTGQWKRESRGSYLSLLSDLSERWSCKEGQSSSLGGRGWWRRFQTGKESKDSEACRGEEQKEVQCDWTQRERAASSARKATQARWWRTSQTD